MAISQFLPIVQPAQTIGCCGMRSSGSWSAIRMGDRSVKFETSIEQVALRFTFCQHRVEVSWIFLRSPPSSPNLLRAKVASLRISRDLNSPNVSPQRLNVAGQRNDLLVSGLHRLRRRVDQAVTASLETVAVSEERARQLKIDVVSLFPETISAALSASIPARALERGLATLTCHDLRTWGIGKHRTVDDEPYGGGAGMLMRPEPLVNAIEALRGPESIVILFDAGGERLRQPRLRSLATAKHLIVLCGRYEGIDDRVRAFVDLELSLGDFVLSGGEPAAIVLCDAILRLVPGAIDEASLSEESFSSELLEYPQFTRPAEFRGVSVPEVLLSGNHAAVAAWRREEAVRRTRRQRPDLADGSKGGSRS